MITLKRQRYRQWGPWFVASLYAARALGYDPSSRWGQASVVVAETLYVYGGKIDEFNEFGYTSAPNTNDILYLPLSDTWPVDAPPWELVSSSTNSSTSQGPALAWSSLSAVNWNRVLHFGGQPHPNLAGSDELTDQHGDSAVLLDVFNRLEPQWKVSERVEIKNQPARRFRHATTTLPSGQVIISGGEKPDGSQTCLDDVQLFDPATLSFSAISAAGEGGPPGLCGHASIPLPDGRVLFFGGYSSSQNELPDLSVIWVLDTAKTPYTWSRLEVDTASGFPHGRRAFAAALIDPDKILIHGGADASFQNTYSDGWILDLSRTPAVWLEVPALSELGPRRDHFAVPQGNSVVFGFGWGTSGPVSPGLQVFDTDKNAWVPTFTPAPPLVTPTIPLPTQPMPTGSSVSGTQTPPVVTPAPTDPNDPNTPPETPAQHEKNRKRVTAIAVSTTFGVLALLLALIGVYYYRRHRHRRFWDERRFAPVSGDDNAHSPFNDDDDDSQLHRPIPRVAGFEDEKSHHGKLHGLAGMILGATAGAAATLKNKRPGEAPARRNMLDDEDANDFGAWYDKRRKDGSGNSSWSLMSFFQGRRSREPSISTTPWREKNAYFDPFSDPRGASRMGVREDDEATGLVAGGGVVRPGNRRGASYVSTRSGLSYASYPSYNDPFQDPIQEEVRGPSDTAYAGGGEGDIRLVPHPPYPQPLQPGDLLPLDMHVGHALSPLSEKTSQSTLPVYDSSGSSNDHMNDMSRFSTTASAATSMTSAERPTSPILFSNLLPAPSERPQRNGSWWRRLSVSSRRRSDSIGSRSGGVGGNVGYGGLIRDPNPPPRLVTIEEASVQSPGSKASSGVPTPKTGNTPPGEIPPPTNALNALQRHGKSSSSLRTNDTDLIDRMAGTMEVAQRVKTRSGSGDSASPSQHWRRSTGSTGEESLADSLVGRRESRGHEMVLSPTEMESHESIAALPVVPPRTHSPTRVPPISMYNNSKAGSTPSPVSPISPSGSVAARIQEFEKKRKSGGAEEEKKEKRAAVDYGLVPRRSLFVANPDHRKSQSSLESS